MTSGSILRALRPCIGLAIVLTVFALHPQAEGFLSVFNFKIVANQTVIVGLAAIGATFVIVSGGIDLSVGSIIALSSVVCALVLRAEYGVTLAMVSAIIAGCVCGLVNGLMITMLRIAPFVATLGMLGIARGAAKWISGEQKVDVPPAALESGGLQAWMSNRPDPEWLWFSPGVWTTILLALIAAYVLRRSVFGIHVTAIGSNEKTARLCGIRIERTKIAIYSIAGACAGLAGFMLCARLTVGNPTAALGKELDVIAAVVIGGASLAGGQGGVLGSMLGALMMAFLASGCKMTGSATYVQEILIGTIIVVAVSVDVLQRRRA
ncbi:MAG: ABC transporter permease [Planctomycetes bacterium]|nr:ABC transporter permease [Planctomycetota bacterium]